MQNAVLRHIRRDYDKLYACGSLHSATNMVMQRSRELGCHCAMIVTDREFLLTSRDDVITVQTADVKDEWALKAIALGACVWKVSVKNPGIIHDLMEAMIYRHGEVKRYDSTIADAIVWGRERQAALMKKARDVEGKVERMAEDPETGMVIWELLDQQALSREGLMMDHCVGDVGKYPLLMDVRRILSVRTSDGASRATIELGNLSSGLFRRPHNPPMWRIVQFRGHSNFEPEPEVRAFVDKVAESIGITNDPMLVERRLFGDRLLPDGQTVDASAYQLAVAAGFNGSIDAWLTQLRGPTAQLMAQFTEPRDGAMLVHHDGVTQWLTEASLGPSERGWQELDKMILEKLHGVDTIHSKQEEAEAAQTYSRGARETSSVGEIVVQPLQATGEGCDGQGREADQASEE